MHFQIAQDLSMIKSTLRHSVLGKNKFTNREEISNQYTVIIKRIIKSTLLLCHNYLNSNRWTVDTQQISMNLKRVNAQT